METVYHPRLVPAVYLVLVDVVPSEVLAPEEERDQRGVLLALHQLLLLLQVAPERRQPRPRRHEDDLLPLHGVSEGGLAQFRPEGLRLPQEELAHQSIGHQTGRHDHIALGAVVRGNREQPWRHGVRQLNEVFEGELDLVLPDEPDEIVPLLLVCDALELFGGLDVGVLGEVARVGGRELGELLEGGLGQLALQVYRLLQEETQSVGGEVELHLLVLVRLAYPHPPVEGALVQAEIFNDLLDYLGVVFGVDGEVGSSGVLRLGGQLHL